ncbi:DUF3810 domain-containing protein [Candidatus Clostridium stratigraminis]|uniref:DUF3810 domain-containing protein n=1 Tax=Candidatus Clostridium stratigraminis TaxID=3381661 RepID=A0ABW8T795_9CLOT
MIKKPKLKMTIILLVPIIMLLNIITAKFPGLVEKYYSNTINKVIRQGLSYITSPFPSSFAEILLPLLIIILILFIFLILINVRKAGFFNRAVNLAVYVSILYILFMLLWGFNYNRYSFDKIAGLKVENSSEKELYNLCEDLINRANNLRAKVIEDSNGVMTFRGGFNNVFKREQMGFDAASKIYPELGGSYGPPKRILLSEPMSYTGITGIYIPYTGEANVNINETDFMLPCTAAHEMAHQRGFAREDEANYIAYVVCSMHPDVDFQYSGTMLALIYSMNALADTNYNDFKELRSKYSTGVLRDLNNDSKHWEKYKGNTEKITNKVNNTYLKSNGQQDGIASYGRMVDLLLAEYRSKKLVYQQ